MSDDRDVGDEPDYGPSDRGGDEAISALLDATRALLWIKTATDASAVARDLIGDLGGVIVPALGATSDALPVDVSFGVDEPVLPAAPHSNVARMLLERHLPTFVRDAQRALELADQRSRFAEDALDSLTALANCQILRRAPTDLFPARAIRVMLVDHRIVVLDGLRLLIEEQNDLVVVGQAASLREAASSDANPDVVVADVDLPDGQDCDVVRKLREIFTRSSILVLTLIAHPANVQSALEAGADGYLLKTEPPSTLITAIGALASGDTYLQPSLGVPLARWR